MHRNWIPNNIGIKLHFCLLHHVEGKLRSSSQHFFLQYTLSYYRIILKIEFMVKEVEYKEKSLLGGECVGDSVITTRVDGVRWVGCMRV
jgi:hypothetical protein